MSFRLANYETIFIMIHPDQMLDLEKKCTQFEGSPKDIVNIHTCLIFGFEVPRCTCLELVGLLVTENSCKLPLPRWLTRVG